MDEKTFERDVQHNLGVQEQGPEDSMRRVMTLGTEHLCSSGLL